MARLGMTAAIVMAVILVAASAGAAAERPPSIKGAIYVSALGKDTGTGTEESPFAAIAQAQAAVRALVARGLKAPVTVVIRGGGYDLAQPLAFGPEDSGTAEFPITWTAAKGERVLVSGGRRITGWQSGKDGIWTAQVPGVTEGKWYPRAFFVGSGRAIRARTPNKDDTSGYLQLRGAAVAQDLSRWEYQFEPGQLRGWTNMADVEAVVLGNWEITRKRFKSVDFATGTASMAGPHAGVFEMNAPAAGRRFYLENALEMLDRPGEWYLDRRTGVLSYRPPAGQDMLRPDMVLPVLATLLEIKGTASRPVRNLHFRGFTFSYTDWPLPAAGYVGMQAGHYNLGPTWFRPDYDRTWPGVGAAIRMESAEACSVEEGQVTHVGGSAVEIGPRCRACVVRANRISDVGATGAMVGGPRDETIVPRDSQIVNNHIYNCGMDYPGAAGVWVGFAEGTVVSHNDIHDLPYTGVSVGWQWNSDPAPSKGHRIEGNHIHDVMALLCDGGGIYTLGYQPGTVISGNHIHGVLRSPMSQAAPNNGIFIDEGSKGITLERNLIYATSGDAIRFNQSSRELHTWKDNITSGAGLPAAGSPDDGPARQIIDGAGIEAPYRDRLMSIFPR